MLREAIYFYLFQHDSGSPWKYGFVVEMLKWIQIRIFPKIASREKYFTIFSFS